MRSQGKFNLRAIVTGDQAGLVLGNQRIHVRGGMGELGTGNEDD